MKNKKIFFIFVAVIFVLFSKANNVNAVNPTNYPCKNGDLIESLNLSNNLLIIGDSRMCQLYNAKQTASYVCIWGGHYFGNDNSMNSPTRKQTVKKYIDEIVKKHGNCVVMLEATINDYEKEYLSTRVKLFTDYAQEIATYNSKAKVYITSLIECYGQDVSDFNNMAKEKVKASNGKYEYINIRPSNVQFSDGGHFTNQTIKDVYQIMLKAAKNTKPTETNVEPEKTTKKFIKNLPPKISKKVVEDELILNISDSDGIDEKEIKIYKIDSKKEKVEIKSEDLISTKVKKTKNENNIQYKCVLKSKNFEVGANQLYFEVKDKKGLVTKQYYYVKKYSTGKFFENNSPRLDDWEIDENKNLNFIIRNGGKIAKLVIYDGNNNNKIVLNQTNVAERTKLTFETKNLTKKNEKYYIKVMTEDLQGQKRIETFRFKIN